MDTTPEARIDAIYEPIANHTAQESTVATAYAYDGRAERVNDATAYCTDDADIVTHAQVWDNAFVGGAAHRTRMARIAAIHT